MYITSEDYKEFTGVTELPESFTLLVNLAGAELDTVTRFYYQFNELADDFKSRQFKKALILQIMFFDDHGITTVEELNNKATSVRLGDMTVQYGRQGNRVSESERASALSKDALNALRGTGLLYRGVSY